MASLALASVADLEIRMGPLSNSARAQAMIADASALIHAETNSVWVDGGELVADIPAIVLTVCCKVAERALTNPDGVTSESLGPFSQSVANATTDLYLTKNERRLLARAAGGGGMGAIALESPYPMRPALSTVYVPWIDDESEAFPMGPFPVAADD